MGNWKMNPATLGKAEKLFLDIRKGMGRKRDESVEVVIAAPYPYIATLEQMSPSQRIGLGAQDIFYEAGGAHTGEVSATMLKSVGVSYVIVGHSERRARGENDEEVYQDVQAVLSNKLKVVLCVGEKERDSAGNYFGVVEAQLRAALAGVSEKDLKRIVIAYEPIWAIGTGKTATPEDAEEMRLFIQKILVGHFNRSAAEKVRVLYGGSVNKTNAKELLEGTQVSGFLIGGASLKASEFVNIINTTKKHLDD